MARGEPRVPIRRVAVWTAEASTVTARRATTTRRAPARKTEGLAKPELLQHPKTEWISS